MSPWTTVIPNRVPLDAATMRSRQFAVSAMSTSPDGSRATPVGSSSSLCAAGPPSPADPATLLPANPTSFPATTDLPNDDPVVAGNSSTRLPGPKAMKRLPAVSTATALGAGSAAVAHGPPATVRISPACPCWPKVTPALAVTSRTRQLPVSAMNRSPDASSAMPEGSWSCAPTAAPPSPANPGMPVPAMVVAPGAVA